jgi:ligand-binding SRPBCC domain-containing protein
MNLRHIFEYESVIAAPAQTVFAFHERPDALRLLIPPGQPIRVLEHTGGIRDGAKVVLRIGYWPLLVTWSARHQGYVEGRQFQDVQDSGPFRFWEHTHTVIPRNSESCLLRDHIEYEVILGAILKPLIRHQLQKLFTYRHRITAQQVS